MALSFSEKFRSVIDGKAMRIVEVTSDGSTATITAENLGLNYILEAMVMNNTDLSGSATWDPGSIANGAEEAKEVTVTGAALGDFAIASFSKDVSDLVLDAQVTGSDTVTCVLANNTGGAVDLEEGTVSVKVFKNVGLSTRSGTYIVLSPALAYTGDVVTILAIGY